MLVLSHTLTHKHTQKYNYQQYVLCKLKRILPCYSFSLDLSNSFLKRTFSTFMCLFFQNNLPEFLIPFPLLPVSKRIFPLPGLPDPRFFTSLWVLSLLLSLRAKLAVLCSICFGGLILASVCCLVGSLGSERFQGSAVV